MDLQLSMERLMKECILDSVDGSTVEEKERNFALMPEDERNKLVAKIKLNPEKLYSKMLGGDTFSMFDHIYKVVNSQPANLPLSKIRDKDGPFTNRMCAGCMKSESVELKRCVRCKASWYCSATCQRLDWVGKGKGPAKPQKHKDLCPEFSRVNEEFQTSTTAGEFLRSTYFASWANQHHEEGTFFMHEFLARRKVLGGANVGFWAMKDSMGPYQTPEKDHHGFQNGQMLLDCEDFPSMKDGWTTSLKENEYPPGSPPSKPVPEDGIISWEEYMSWRNLSPTSIAPLLLTNVLTVYQMIHRELRLTICRKDLVVYLLGVEKELNQIPLFGELLYLLPAGTDLTLVFLSPATKELCAEGRKRAKKNKRLLINRPDYVVWEASDESTGSHLRVKLEPNYKCYDEIPNETIHDGVICLNAGLGSYPEWNETVYRILYMRTPFCVTDQTIVTMKFVQNVYLPHIVDSVNKAKPYLHLVVPSFANDSIKLNPFHGIVGRDVAALAIPNISNGYLLSFNK